MKYWQVDSFTSEVFCGNPAGVCILKEPIHEEDQQKIATEVNLSETAFVLFSEAGLRIRWFTPRAEVNLCGHATLAAAHVLWQKDFIHGDEVKFSSKSGVLKVSRLGPETYSLSFPQQPPVSQHERVDMLSDALQCREIEFAGSNGEDCIVIVDSVDALRTISPDLQKVASLTERGLVVSAPTHTGPYDFEYRAFFPKLGIAEDPVTGSACTALGPYWGKRLNKDSLKAFQCSARGGELDLALTEDRVCIAGNATMVLEGEFYPHVLKANR
jgi:PhzF family phenazine biosynthesis protein